ncbi:pyrimidine dimer DNA glycosylase/endonuclease V [Brevibacterium sp. CS2]|uniref:pyrimidine dimer DNA glycosylase/endonuclease V n=1 Tax=Brevibacterium sp. CS2 TaxID=2575923 RepID=UPI0010C79162|nr:pyrimidine dimer DNA glycosylase/endonuclease V [Brevibacterium sp. CS2]QCP06552.1 hypothetical protein FDF13_10560 [Brevibacterium sp. CS2]
MRIWSLHPASLDRQGLIACWRETLLAQKVLRGGTRGYRSHPQLLRFREQADPVAAIGAYLTGLADEADVRGYRFDRGRIISPGDHDPLPVTAGQVDVEWSHLLRKLDARTPEQAEVCRRALGSTGRPRLHGLFHEVPGPRESWERV